MHLSITFVGLWYKNLSKALKVSIEYIKLLGSCVQRGSKSERFRVKYIIVSVFYDWSMHT